MNAVDQAFIRAYSKDVFAGDAESHRLGPDSPRWTAAAAYAPGPAPMVEMHYANGEWYRIDQPAQGACRPPVAAPHQPHGRPRSYMPPPHVNFGSPPGAPSAETERQPRVHSSPAPAHDSRQPAMYSRTPRPMWRLDGPAPSHSDGRHEVPGNIDGQYVEPHAVYLDRQGAPGDLFFHIIAAAPGSETTEAPNCEREAPGQHGARQAACKTGDVKVMQADLPEWIHEPPAHLFYSGVSDEDADFGSSPHIAVLTDADPSLVEMSGACLSQCDAEAHGNLVQDVLESAAHEHCSVTNIELPQCDDAESLCFSHQDAQQTAPVIESARADHEGAQQTGDPDASDDSVVEPPNEPAESDVEESADAGEEVNKMEAAGEEQAKEFIPAWEVDRFKWPDLTDELLEAAEVHFQQIASALVEAAKGGTKVLAVTGSRRGEGRTTLAICIAREAAKLGASVALVDGDFDNPQIGGLLNIEGLDGWEDVVSGRLPLSEAAICSLLDKLTVFPLLDRGKAASASRQSARIAEALKEAAEAYDLVLVDMGPVSKLSAGAQGGESPSLAAALVVRDTRHSTDADVQKAAQQLQGAGVQTVGVVETFARYNTSAAESA